MGKNSAAYQQWVARLHRTKATFLLVFRSYLQHWTCAQDGPLHPAGVALLAECGQTVDQEVSALRFAGATLPGYNDTLVDPLPEHGVVGHVGDGEDVRLQLAQLVVLVHLDVFGVVDGQELEGVDGDEDAPGVGVDLFLVEACSQVVQYAVLIEDREVAEVRKVVLWRRQEAPRCQLLHLLLLGDRWEVDVMNSAIMIPLLGEKTQTNLFSDALQKIF